MDDPSSRVNLGLEEILFQRKLRQFHETRP